MPDYEGQKAWKVWTGRDDYVDTFPSGGAVVFAETAHEAVARARVFEQPTIHDRAVVHVQYAGILRDGVIQ